MGGEGASAIEAAAKAERCCRSASGGATGEGACATSAIGSAARASATVDAAAEIDALPGSPVPFSTSSAAGSTPSASLEVSAFGSRSGNSSSLHTPQVGQVHALDLSSALPPHPTHNLANLRLSSLGTSNAPIALNASPSWPQNALSPVIAVLTPHAGCQLPAWNDVSPSMQICSQSSVVISLPPSCPAQSVHSG